MARSQRMSAGESRSDALWRRAASPWIFGGITLLLLLPWFLRHHYGRFDTETDFFGEYGPHARLFMAGQIPADWPYRGPGYHLALAGLGFLVPDLFTAGKLLAVLSAAVFVGLTTFMVRQVAGPRAAVVAGILCLVQPALLLYGWTVGNDMFFSALVLASLAALQQALLTPGIPKPGGGARGAPEAPAFNVALVVAGLLAGAALLTRPNGLSLPIVAAVALLGLDRLRPLRDRVARTLLFLAGFAVPTLLWPLVYRGAHGHFPRSAGYRNLLEGIYAAEITASVDVYRRSVEDTVSGFGEFASRYGLKLLQSALVNIPDYLRRNALEVHGVALALLAAGGLVVLIRTRWRPGPPWLLVLAGALLFPLLLLTIYAPRLFIPLCAPAAFLGALCLVNPETQAWRRWPAGLAAFRGVGLPLVIGGVALLSLWPALRQNAHMLGMEEISRGEFEAGRFLAGFPGVPGAVAARKPHVAWEAHRSHRGVPVTDLTQLPDSLRSRGVAFLSYGPTEMEFLPQYLPLTAAAGIPAGLQVVWIRAALPPRVIFRVLPPGDPATAVPESMVQPLVRLGELLDTTGLRERFAGRLANDHYIKGQLELRNGRPREALAAFRNARAMAPGSVELLYLFGCAATQSGEWQEGYDAVIAAEAQGARSDELDYIVALAAFGLGRLPESDTRLAAFLARNERHPLGLFLKAQLRGAQGRVDEAREALVAARQAGFADEGQMSQLLARLRATEPIAR